MCSMLMCAYTSYDINLDNYRFVCVFVCFLFHLFSSTCCFPSLSRTQTVRNSDTYSINCQHNQRQYVRTLTSNTTNTAETEASVYLTWLLKYSPVVQRKSECSASNRLTLTFLSSYLGSLSRWDIISILTRISFQCHLTLLNIKTLQ